jgi:Flp pilus assembly protein TadG
MARIRFPRIRLPSLGKRGTSGTVAIEFAMIAPVFFLLLFATLETGMVYFADMVLANGVQATARLIRTGQAQAQNMSATEFRQRLCTEISFMLKCDSSQLLIDVRSFNSFSGANFPQPLDAQGNANAGLNSFQPGGSSQISGGSPIVLVRAFYIWQLMTPMFANYYANMPGGKRMIAASVAFRNEPF